MVSSTIKVAVDVNMVASDSEYAVDGDGCYVALLTTSSFTWMLPAVGARSLRCFAIRSPGIRRRQPRHRDTIPNDISSQRRECPSTPVRSGASQFALRASAAVSHDTEIPYQMTYPARDMRVRPGTRSSAHGTMLRLYVRQPGRSFSYIHQVQRINCQKIAIDMTHRNSCQVVCFFIGPGDYRLLQCADN